MGIEFLRVQPELGMLDRRLRALWQLGGNALVGWRPVRDGIEVIACPIGTLFARVGKHRRVFSGNRLMGMRTFERVAKLFGVTPSAVPLPKPVGAGSGMLPTAAVERCVARYAVVHTDHRAVFVIDIAGFSLLTPEEQATQIATLGYAINLAEARAVMRNLPVDLARSSTGDGFYLWNRRRGLDADAALFALFALALGTHAWLQPTLSPSGAPAIRSAFGIGSHYTYHQRDGIGEASHDYIVGDVTIRLARLVERAARNQILLADFSRDGGPSDAPLNPENFVALASAAVTALEGTEIGGATVERIAAYLTGPRGENGGFAVRRFGVVDKHGRRHDACNAKINITLRGAPPLYLGLQDSALVAAMA